MNPGDPVLYHPGDGSETTLGVVVKVASHDGDCDIDYRGAPEVLALDVKMGQGPHTFEPLDMTPNWTIIHCPGCGHRLTSFMSECFACHTHIDTSDG